MLGEVLEKVRASCVDDSEIEGWISATFAVLEGPKKAMPTIQMEVYREKQLIESIKLEHKPVFVFGRNPAKCDVQLLHESISRQHAAIVIDKEKGVQLVDLGSRAETKLDDKAITPCIPVSLKKSGNEITFGLSSRRYRVTVDYSRMERAVENQQKELEKEMEILK